MYYNLGAFWKRKVIVYGNRLYVCDVLSKKFYELDSDTLVNLSGAGVDSPGGAPSVYLC